MDEYEIILCYNCGVYTIEQILLQILEQQENYRAQNTLFKIFHQSLLRKISQLANIFVLR